MDVSQDREILSLCGDVQFRVSLVPRGVTEQKLQRVLDARLPDAFVELWKGKKKNIQGRLSVPKEVAAASTELQCVINSIEGHFIFIGPIKVYLRKEGQPRNKLNMKKKIVALEKKQLEMQMLMAKMSDLLQNQTNEMTRPLPSPGRDGGFTSDRKRGACTNLVCEKKHKIRKRKKEIEAEENTGHDADVLDPENLAELDSAIQEMERREYRSQPSRNAKPLVQVRAYLQGIIEEERSSISSLSFDGMGD